MCAPGSDTPPRSDAGFTLIEALMTLLIVALLAGAVALATPAPDAKARAEAERLAARLVLASDDSVMRNRTVGLMMTSQGYGFARLEAEGWRPIEEAGPLQFRALPPGIRAVNAALGAEDGEGPLARFDPIGTATPTQVRVEGGGGAFVVAVTAQGGVRVAAAP